MKEYKMNIIWKFNFEITDYIELEMPKGAEILSVQTQHETPCIWAGITAGNGTEIRKFRVFGTGQPITMNENGLKFIGTFQLMNGSFVGHLFEDIGVESVSN